MKRVMTITRSSLEGQSIRIDCRMAQPRYWYTGTRPWTLALGNQSQDPPIGSRISYCSYLLIFVHWRRTGWDAIVMRCCVPVLQRCSCGSGRGCRTRPSPFGDRGSEKCVASQLQLAHCKHNLKVMTVSDLDIVSQVHRRPCMFLIFSWGFGDIHTTKVQL